MSKELHISIVAVWVSAPNVLATWSETVFQDGCSYTFTLLFIFYIFHVWCFIFRKVDIPTIQYCNICVHGNESKLEATWCPECEDILCTNCSMHHSRSSSSKQQIVISIENYQKLPSHIRSIKNRGTKHGNMYEFYCSIHDIACCVMCIRDGLTQQTKPLEDFYLDNIKAINT
jgi:hypothetical protein